MRFLKREKFSQEQAKRLWNTLLPLKMGTFVKIKTGGYKGKIARITEKKYSKAFQEWMYGLTFANNFGVGYYKREELKVVVRF